MKRGELKKRVAALFCVAAAMVLVTGCSSKKAEDYEDPYPIEDSDPDEGGEDTTFDEDPVTDDDYDSGSDDFSPDDPDTDDTGFDDEGGSDDDAPSEDDFGEAGTGDQSHQFTEVTKEELTKIFASADADYLKVNWGVQYKPADLEGVLIGVTPYEDESSTYLILAVTNLYDRDITISGDGYAVGKNNENIGDFSVFASTLRPGNTSITSILCDGEPTGVLHWNQMEASPDDYDESAAWETNWMLGGSDDGDEVVKYSVICKDKVSVGEVHSMALDKDGFVIAYGSDYLSDEGTDFEGFVPFYGVDQAKIASETRDIVMFANPVKVKE